MNKCYEQAVFVKQKKDAVDLVFAKSVWLSRMESILEVLNQGLDCDIYKSAARMFCVDDVTKFKNEVRDLQYAVNDLYSFLDQLPSTVEEIKLIRQEELNGEKS